MSKDITHLIKELKFNYNGFAIAASTQELCLAFCIHGISGLKSHLLTTGRVLTAENSFQRCSPVIHQNVSLIKEFHLKLTTPKPKSSNPICPDDPLYKRILPQVLK